MALKLLSRSDAALIDAFLQLHVAGQRQTQEYTAANDSYALMAQCFRQPGSLGLGNAFGKLLGQPGASPSLQEPYGAACEALEASWPQIVCEDLAS